MPVPQGVSLMSAAALPEAACTVWSNLVMVAGLAAGETVLVHGGASGIGTMAVQVARLLGATVIVTCGSTRKVDACLALGAHHAINYRDQDFADEVRRITGGRGVDVIMDIVGAKYLTSNVRSLAVGGRLVVIGLQGGATGELDLGRLLAKRASVCGTTLRSRPRAEKADIVATTRDGLWSALGSSEIRPVIDRLLPWTQVADAHRALENGDAIGKIVLAVQDQEASS
jgi:putative PIG3 family NAD(P)H quinone oxidoreductase